MVLPSFSFDPLVKLWELFEGDIGNWLEGLICLTPTIIFEALIPPLTELTNNFLNKS